MQLLKTAFHPDIAPADVSSDSGYTVSVRLATRGIVVNDEKILLLYTERYDDYSLPGGGIDVGESFIEGLKREMKEETGASDLHNISEFGCYEEYRPWYKDDADIVHMKSYCYLCDITGELEEPSLESYELSNGMRPLWVNIHMAIEHNENVIMNSDKKGLSDTA